MLRKRRGVVVNFGSFVGEANCPMPTVYPTSKSACHKFTRDMQVIHRDKAIGQKKGKRSSIEMLYKIKD